MNNAKISKNQQNQYSEKYTTIRREAETKWPAWKVSTYNTNVAVSNHAKKLAK